MGSGLNLNVEEQEGIYKKAKLSTYKTIKFKRVMLLIWVLIACMFCGEKLRNKEERERHFI